MDGRGRGSPPWETVEWLEQTLKKKGSTNTTFAQVLERADPSVVLDQYDRRLSSFGSSFMEPFIAHSDRDPASPLRGGLDTASRTRPASSWLFASYSGLWLSPSLPK